MDVALIAFDGVDTAAEAYADACERSGPRDRWRDRIGLVEHHQDGHLVLRGTFAGHYVDVDEAAHTSEEGAAKGWRTGALAGFLLTPAGFAVGNVLGAVIGSQEGEPSERERGNRRCWPTSCGPRYLSEGRPSFWPPRQASSTRC